MFTFSFVLVMLVGASLAQATIITEWSYTAEAVFLDVTTRDSKHYGVFGPVGEMTELKYNGLTTSGYTEYRWGSADRNSGLSLTGASGTVVTNGDSATGVKITHRNQVIPDFYTHFKSASIFTVIKLMGGGEEVTITSTLPFTFKETVNSVKDADRDIFFMTQQEVIKHLGEFSVDGQTYSVSMEGALQELTGNYLRLAQEFLGVGSDVMLYGWTTAEGFTEENLYDLKLSVNAVPIPGAVWLMGTGLAGLAAMRRRARK